MSESTVYVHDPDDDAIAVDDGHPYPDDLDITDEGPIDDTDPDGDEWICNE